MVAHCAKDRELHVQVTAPTLLLSDSVHESTVPTTQYARWSYYRYAKAK